MSSASSGTSTPSSSTSSASTISEDFPFATCSDRRDVPAKTLQYQRLERALDLTAYTRQVEQLLVRPIKIPASHSHSYGKKTFFPLRGIWPNEERRKERLSKMYSFGNIKGRELMRDLILDDSDSDEDGAEITQMELKSILKLYKQEKKLRTKTKGEGLTNSQYAYFSAGLMSTQDNYNDGTRNNNRNKPVEVNASALNTLASLPTPVPPPPPPIHPDDLPPEPLSVDANFPNSTVIPLPPLSH